MAEIIFVDVIPRSPQLVVRGSAPQVINSLTAGSCKLYNTADPVSVTVSPPVTVPGAPTGLTATASAGQVALSWTAPASDGGVAITDYLVQYSSNGPTAPSRWAMSWAHSSRARHRWRPRLSAGRSAPRPRSAP